jgi:uroporphyrinogen-III decarboxylase
MLVMFRELLYQSFFIKRYLGPIQTQFFPYAEGMLSAFDLIPMARGLIPFSRDVRKHKDEIVQAFAFLAKPMTDLMVQLAKITKARTILVGGSRGANSWMSQKDFIDTHWPSLKYTLNTIINAGIIPTCHFDNDWTENIAFFAQHLPKRSCLFHLDQVDLTQVHNLIGDHFCLMGGLKHGFLVLGRPDQVEAKVGEYIRSIGHDGLILASGCEIPIDIPIQNLMAYKKAILKNPLS